MSDEALENLLHEDRVFGPSPEFAAQANVGSAVYEEAAADRLGFWAEQAQRLDWAQPWDEVLDWSDAPFAKWFVGGRLNVAYNCVDRHVEAGLGSRTAIIGSWQCSSMMPVRRCVRNTCRTRYTSVWLSTTSWYGRFVFHAS